MARRHFRGETHGAGRRIPRKAHEIERFAGWARFHAELDRRGFWAVENSGHVVIFCNRAPVRPLERPGWSLPPDF
jgi:hypothetical protein